MNRSAMSRLALPARIALSARGAVLGAAWALPGLAAAQVLPAPQNVVSLAAEASTEVVQDTLSIVLGVTREGAEAGGVQTQLRQVLDAALTEARKAQRPGQVEPRSGVFSLYPRYNARPGAGNSISGWQGRAELILEGRDIAAISQLAGRLGALGGQGSAAGMVVQRVQFSLSREARELAEADVAARAIHRFKARAETYAKHFGFGSYSLREVAVGAVDVGTPQPMLRATRAMASPSSAEESQPVEAGKATVSVTVSGSIQLSPR